MEWIADNLISLIAVIVALGTLIRSMIMTPHEEAIADASVIKSYAEAAEKASERANRLADRLKVLEERMNALADEDSKLRAEQRQYLETIKEYSEILTNWAEGITILLMQIKANQLTAGWIPNPETVDRFRENSKKKGTKGE